MAKPMFFHGAQEDRAEPNGNVQDAPMADQGQSQGDGLHHHEIHQDEAGGFHSKHTNPDGTEDHGDHADYDEAKSDMDQKFGEGGAGDDMEDSGADSGDDFGNGESDDDIAGNYGRKACG